MTLGFRVSSHNIQLVSWGATVSYGLTKHIGPAIYSFLSGKFSTYFDFDKELCASFLLLIYGNTIEHTHTWR